MHRPDTLLRCRFGPQPPNADAGATANDKVERIMKPSSTLLSVFTNASHLRATFVNRGSDCTSNVRSGTGRQDARATQWSLCVRRAPQALAGELTGTGVSVQVCLPGRVSTEFFVGLGIDTSKLPPAMTAENVVTASLSGLARQEVVCIPALDDPAPLREVAEAQIKLFRNSAMQPTLAERYTKQ
jgi:hypothetical protein